MERKIFFLALLPLLLFLYFQCFFWGGGNFLCVMMRYVCSVWEVVVQITYLESLKSACWSTLKNLSLQFPDHVFSNVLHGQPHIPRLEITIYKIIIERLGKAERRQTVSGPQNPRDSKCPGETIQKSQFPIFVSKDWIKTSRLLSLAGCDKVPLLRWCWWRPRESLEVHLYSFPSSLR